jgi:TetR/AcrR family transcriptional regulator, mexJK operon transcriptional repressor
LVKAYAGESQLQNEVLEKVVFSRSSPGRGSGGRPTREEARRLDVRLLDVATRLFMQRGFEGTSIDAVAEVAGVSKPTLYARYRDKRDLFAAVLRGRIRRWLAPIAAAAEAQASATCTENIETTLHELSRQMLTHALTAESAAVQRILAAQAVQFPELATLANEEGWQRAASWVAVLLRRFQARGEIDVGDPELTASLFLNLVLGESRRMNLYNLKTDPNAAEREREAGVTLFLKGVKVR